MADELKKAVKKKPVPIKKDIEKVNTDKETKDEAPKKEKKPKKNRTTKQKVIRAIVITLCIILILLLIALGIFYIVFRHYYDKTNYVDDKDVTTMEASQLQSEVDDKKREELLEPIESSVYDDMSKTAEASISDEDEYSIYESLKESLNSEEGSSLYEEKYESVIASIVDENMAADPNLTPEDIRESIKADEFVSNVIASQASSEAAAELESKASSAYAEKESELMSSAHSSLHESISQAASESAESIVSSMEVEMESQSQAMESQEVVQNSDVYNLLLIGVDYHNYSDTIMLVSLNKTKNTIFMTSILRDTSVSIPGLGMMKLNNAYRFGGAPLLVSTIENNFKVKIDNYAYVAFNGMWTIFDAAGGLDLNISDAEVDVANYYVGEMGQWYNFDPNPYYFTHGGAQHMNGVQILSYCRVRYVGNGDADRTNRQRIAISALVSKLRGMGVGGLNNFLNSVLPLVSHNVPSGTVMDLIVNAGSYINYNLVGLRVPADGTYSVNAALDYMITADLAANANYLKSTIY